jgi:hypothetical protein
VLPLLIRQLLQTRIRTAASILKKYPTLKKIVALKEKQEDLNRSNTNYDQLIQNSKKNIQ